eukprot:1145173-Pelagomonas_calceolata.AAC.4
MGKIQVHIFRHLVEIKYCEDTRPKNQLEASKQQRRGICRDLSRASAQVTLHTFLLGVRGVIYTSHILEPLKELGLDTHTATRLALKLHARSVQYAYKHSSTRRALEKTPLNSRHQDQAQATAGDTWCLCPWHCIRRVNCLCISDRKCAPLMIFQPITVVYSGIRGCALIPAAKVSGS